MNNNGVTKRRHDMAYACFLPPGLLGLISSGAAFVPMDTGTAGGIGFLILIPLGLGTFVSVPLGIYYSAAHWKDYALGVLVITTILMLVQMFAEIGPVRIQNLLWLGYGVLVVTIEAAHRSQ
jgi:hypothetical protein